MLQVGNLKFFVIFSILLLINDTSGLRCWSCSSDATNVKYCGETLDPNQMTEQQQKWSYVKCRPPPSTLKFDNIEMVISKCKIVLQEVREQLIYKRSCEWEEENVPTNWCTDQKNNENNVSFVKTITCNTCINDGCNFKFKSTSVSVEEDKLELSNESVEENTNKHNLAIHSVLSNAIFIIFMLSLIIGV